MKSMEKKYILAVAVLLIVAVAVAGYLYWRSTQRSVEQALEQATAPTIEVATNPLQEKVPNLNPAEKTNPFSGYQNPF